jgi:AcrR family transcriptional regulator
VAAGSATDRGRATRERLETAAVELIAEVGWGNVSTRTVAERAGVPAGAVHYHYASLDELLRTAVAAPLRALAGELTAVLATAGDAPAGVRALLGAVTQQPAGSPTAVLLGEVFVQSSRDEALRAQVAELLDGLRGELTAWLRLHGCGENSAAVATVLTAALDAFGLHRAIDPRLDLTGADTALLRLIGPAR